jgi:hypothetical protein
MTLKIDRQDACKLALACTALADWQRRRANDPDEPIDSRENGARSEAMWNRLHDLVMEQIGAFDEKQAAKQNK